MALNLSGTISSKRSAFSTTSGNLFAFQAGRFGTRLVLRATESERLDAAAGELDDLIVELGAEADWE